MARLNPTRRSVRNLLALVGFVATMVLASSEGRARLHPYYVLKGASFGQLKPRILFVLDTSGSMVWRPDASNNDCKWSECEGADSTKMSRINIARKAIRSVVQQTADQAEFALMTFGHLRPPASSSELPSKCTDLNGSNGHRFEWVQQVNAYTGWQYAYNPFGSTWVLTLCGDNRPFPYLRYDNLGKGISIADDQGGEPPQGPLYPLYASSVDYLADANRYRKVQWFPQFLGVRRNLDCGAAGDKAIVDGSYGDYGNNQVTRTNEVCGKDFYYWPYVDGFPGYSAMNGYGQTSAKTDCVPGGNCAYTCSDSCDWDYDAYNRMGVNRRVNSVHASLFAPFYSDAAIAQLPASEWGPQSENEALERVSQLTSNMVHGGVDAASGTPHYQNVGDVDDYVTVSGNTVTAKPGLTQSNAPFSHESVASYLSLVKTIDEKDVCRPTIAVLITDGQPDPWNTQGSTNLFTALPKLRKRLGVRTYLVGFNEGFQNDATQWWRMQSMACAAAGSDSTTNPCAGPNAYAWDTCRDSSNPAEGCAYMATSLEQLVGALVEIVGSELELDVSSGPGVALNEFGASEDGKIGTAERVQTRVTAYTETPDWRGHVVRAVCTDVDENDIDGDGDKTELLPWCTEPTPAFTAEQLQEDFGPCPQSRNWDAGECLQQMNYWQRRLYTNDTNNQPVRIDDGNGAASAGFQAQLDGLGLLTSADKKAEADAIARFILGKDWPGGWKLPGLASSAPVVVRRVPREQLDFIPSVPIRDPHCGGRVLLASQNDDIPAALRDFSDQAWETKLASPSEHYQYQEAVLVGDDMGVLHAFQLDSGNELWGFLPRFLLDTAVQQAKIGPASVGQPEKLEDHIYGISSTVNQGFVHDGTAFRHIAVFGLGAGGSEFVTLDVTHMSPVAPDGPFEILWTSEDPGLKADYDAFNGQTWARPALTYELEEYQIGELPKSYLVMGTGYIDGAVCGDIGSQAACDAHSHCTWSAGACKLDMSASDRRGRVLMLADALTGKIESDGVAELPIVTTPVYEQYFGSVVDPAVASHCRSRFWAEMEEAYVADPAGRLFRWDLGLQSGVRSHAADSEGEWNGTAQPVVRLPACQGSGDTCTVSAANKGDVFVFGAAVTANDRIDDFANPDSDIDGEDQFLVALVSGGTHEDTIDWSAEGNDFHSSLYLLVDDHRKPADGHEGFSIPAGAPKMTVDQVGSNPSYLRLSLSDIERERTFTPFPGSQTYVEKAKFSRRARPIRAPRIVVRGVVAQGTQQNDEPEVFGDAEQVDVEFQIYEPGPGECDARFYDPAQDDWHFDEGSTYVITFRLTVQDGNGFDFAAGYQGAQADFGSGGGLRLLAVEQIRDGACADGNCGPTLEPPKPVPCDNNQGGPPVVGGYAVPLQRTELVGFTPIE